MAIAHFVATVKDSRTLELPEEAQELGLKPGEQVLVDVDRNSTEAKKDFPPNEGMLAVMREIAERQKNRPYTDGSNTMKLLREARAGAMYGDDPCE